MHEGHDHDYGTNEHTPGKSLALLTYMAEHNRQHAKELNTLSHELEHEGAGAVCDMIDEAAELFNRGNDLLVAALDALKMEG